MMPAMTAASATAAGGGTAEPRLAGRARLVVVLGSMCAFITSLNQSIMSVAYADLRRSFPDVSASRLSWVLNVYTIVAGSTLVLSAVVSNRFGRKRVLLTGLALFTVAGLACTAAPDPDVLVAARAVQAIGWALITPSAVAVILADVPAQRRASAIATWGGVGGVATTLGPSVGAWLIEVGTWRAAFAVSLPFAVGVLAAGAAVFRESAPDELVREGLPDPLGALALFGGMTVFILGLVESPVWGWGDPRTLGCIAAGVALVVWLLRRSTRVPRPLLDPRLLRYRNLRLAVLLSVGYGTGFFATNLGLVLFLTQVWHCSVVRAGVLITPVAAMVTLLSPIAGRVADRRGHRVLVVPAGFFWAAGACWLLLRASETQELATTWFPAVVLLGIGSGLGWPTIHGIPVIGVEQRDFSPAVATNQTVLRAVGSLGVAIAITLVSTSSSAASLTPFRRLFVWMAVSGLLLSLVGAFVDTRPRRA